MFPTTRTTQIITPFGSGYVPLQHDDPTCWNLAPADTDDMVKALKASILSEMLKSLRSALSLR
jgi:hypothetical protein